jgi:hypothetical protein
MTSWRNHVKLLPGEDEDALKSEFVKISALYKTYSIFEVGQFVFKDLPEAMARGQQAGSIWGNDLAIRERIRLYIPPAGGETPEEYLIRQAKLIIEDPNADNRDKNQAMVTIGRLSGIFKKELEPEDAKAKAGGLPNFNFVKKDFSAKRPANAE